MSVTGREGFYENAVKAVGLRKCYVDRAFEIFTKAKARDKTACQVENDSKVLYNLSVQLNQHDCPKRKKLLISTMGVFLTVCEASDSKKIQVDLLANGFLERLEKQLATEKAENW